MVIRRVANYKQQHYLLDFYFRNSRRNRQCDIAERNRVYYTETTTCDTEYARRIEWEETKN